MRELAEYERAPEQVVATESDFREALFGASPAVFALVAEHDGHAVVGFAMYFRNFSTWLGKHGIYLEDLYVQPEFRRAGLGRAFLAELARECIRNNYGRLEWWVLDWNTPAWNFYREIGADPMDEWTVHRVTGDALRTLADEEPV